MPVKGTPIFQLCIVKYVNELYIVQVTYIWSGLPLPLSRKLAIVIKVGVTAVNSPIAGQTCQFSFVLIHSFCFIFHIRLGKASTIVDHQKVTYLKDRRKNAIPLPNVPLFFLFSNGNQMQWPSKPFARACVSFKKGISFTSYLGVGELTAHCLYP